MEVHTCLIGHGMRTPMGIHHVSVLKRSSFTTFVGCITKICNIKPMGFGEKRFFYKNVTTSSKRGGFFYRSLRSIEKEKTR